MTEVASVSHANRHNPGGADSLETHFAQLPADVIDGKVVKWNKTTKQFEDATALLNGAYVAPASKTTMGTAAPAAYVNVIDHGAVGDGTTDCKAHFDAAAAQAIALGIPLLVPKGTFLLSAGLSYTGSLSIVGTGSASILKITGNSTVPYVRVINAQGCVFRDFAITGTATVREPNGVGLWLQTSDGCKIDHVYVTSTAAGGVILVDCTRSTVNSCEVSGCLADGISVVTGAGGPGSFDISIMGNHVINSGDDGISIVSYSTGTQIARVVVTGNTIENSKARGIANVGGHYVTITGNTIDGTASSGVLVAQDTGAGTTAPSDTNVTGNIINNAGQVTPRVGNQDGVETLASVRTLITANAITNAYGRGINISGSSDAHIVGNVITTVGQSGIEIGSADVEVVANRITGCGLYGVFTDGSGWNRVVVNDNTIRNANLTGPTYIDSVYLIGNDIVCNGNLIIDDNAKTQRAWHVMGAGITVRGNQLVGNLVTAVEPTSTSVLTDPISISGTSPTGTMYVAGQQWWRSDTHVFGIYDGAAWRTATLT